MDPLRHLNFLKIKPLINWLDYFLDRKEFSNFLEDEKDNSKKLELADQFMQQAITTDEDVLEMQKKGFDIEDVAEIQGRSRSYWFCSMACVAACEWDIEILSTFSDTIRIKSLFDQLITLFLSKPYEDICLADFDATLYLPSNLFAYWLYSLWILHLDSTSRFMEPPVKPTVSNPYLQIDHSLLQAERIKKTTIALRETTGIVAANLQKIQLLTFDFIYVPRPEFFFACLDMQAKIGDFTKLFTEIDLNFFHCVDKRKMDAKAGYALMAAHFSARHFGEARGVLTKTLQIIDEIGLSTFTNGYIKIDKEIINGYKIALGLMESKKEIDDCFNHSESVNLIDYADPTASFSSKFSTSLQLIKRQKCISATHLITQNVMQHSFLEALKSELNASLDSLKMKTKGQVHYVEQDIRLELVKLSAAIYFLAALCPGFAESIINDPFFNEQSIRSFIYTKRKLVQSIEALEIFKCRPIPSNATLGELASSGPAFWNLLTSFNVEVLRSAIKEWDPAMHELPYRHYVSNVIAEPILNKTDQKLFNRSTILLWRVEQLFRLSNVKKWEALLNILVSKEFHTILVREQTNVFLICSDIIRVKTEIWNMNFCRSDTLVDHTETIKSLIESVEKTMDSGIQLNSPLSGLALPVCSFLLNNRRWQYILTSMKKDSRCLKSPYIDLSIILAAYFQEAINNEIAATQIALSHFWKVIIPTFESTMSRRGQSSRGALISQRQLIDFLSQIRDASVIDFFLGFCIFLYNAFLSIKHAEEPVQTPQVSDNIPIANPEAHIRATKKTLKKANGEIILAEIPPVQIAQHAPVNQTIMKSVDLSIYSEMSSLWQQVNLDDFINRLDIEFLYELLDLIFKNAYIANPIKTSWLRSKADYAFARCKYREAVIFYLETIIALDQNIFTPSMSRTPFEEKFNMEAIYSKIVAALYFLRMPTLSAIFGQFLPNVEDHLKLVEPILQSTYTTVDAGPVYFPLLANIDLVEKMAASYDKFDLPIYHGEMIKRAFDRSINASNSPAMLECETNRRKLRLFEVMISQFFELNY